MELYESLAITALFFKIKRGSALKVKATCTSDPLDIVVFLAYEAGLSGALCLFKGCRFKDTPDGSSNVVLGRYFRIVVAWARLN